MDLFRNGVGEKAEAVLRGTSIGEITIRYFVPSASQILDMMNKIGSSVGSLYQLDHRLGKRGGES